MADGRKNNSGTLGNNGGRPPKSDEIALIARLSPMDNLALKLLNDKLEEGDMAALKMFMEYRWSKPRQEVAIDGDLLLSIPAPVVYNTSPPIANNENDREEV